MYRQPSANKEFYDTIQSNELVFLFGTGISAALTGCKYSWWKWIVDGMDGLSERAVAEALRNELEGDSSTANMVSMVGKVIDAAKRDDTYNNWMQSSFETNRINNPVLVKTLRKLVLSQVVFATTNYDLLLENATGLESVSYEDPATAFDMLDKHLSTHILHIHGIYDSRRGVDSIIADETQYRSVMENQGAQFIQHILGTRTLVFVGSGKTAEDPNISRFVEFAKTHLKMDRTYYFLCKEPVEGLPKHIVPIQYGDDYGDLPAFLEEIAQIRLQKRIQADPIVGLTAFSEVPTTSDGLLRYHFSQRTIPFCGRHGELLDLQGFIEANNVFCWWSLTGQAGAGKSRLAMELLYQLPTSWFGFFLHEEITEAEVKSFTPFCNTLVIIDYVEGRERFVAEAMLALNRVFATTDFKLRVLLLERNASRAEGSWYSKLLRRMSRVDDQTIKAAEYADRFLNLDDLERADVEAFIAAVCASRGVSDDYTEDLYEAYSNKYERLRFRPLYLQLFVEAWIENGRTIPQYDSYTQLLESLLEREQKRWLDAVSQNQSVCNALIRLIIRANISGRIALNSIPDLYQTDWNTVNDYISSSSFVGKQRQELQDTLLNSFCQNIDHEHALISPQFPDIIKEYMFAYYTDHAFLSEMMKEIWQHSASAFSSFIRRCLMDFPEQAFFIDALNAYKVSTTDYDVLRGRLTMLNARVIQKGEDPWTCLQIIENEHRFWSSISIPPEQIEENDILGVAKVTGLFKVAQNIGAWSLYDLTEAEAVIGEMLSVTGGQLTEIHKKALLQEHITELSTKGFLDEARIDREKLNAMLGNVEGELDSLLWMQSSSDEMIAAILAGNLHKAKRILLRMEEKCNYTYRRCVQALAHSCSNISEFSRMMGQPDMIRTACGIAVKCEHLFPDDWSIQSRRIHCQTALLLHERFADKVTEAVFRDRLSAFEQELSFMAFNGSESDEALDTAWGSVKTAKMNVASDSDIRTIIRDADMILKNGPHLTSVVATRITATRALYQEFLHARIPHEEVENLFRYVEKNPESESIRTEFFEMLLKSVDAGHISDYLNGNILREAISDARYNPVSGSGIPLLDDVFGFPMPDRPYVRAHPKVGRNDPCPCGSGRKFKKCCMNKGIYD